jgi:AraC-like DNA-binding protein
MVSAFSRYREWRPTQAPRRFVARVWTREVCGNGPHRQCVVPDGCVDLMWLNGSLLVAGPDRGPRTVALDGGTYVAGVRFRPGAARLLLGAMPTRELRDAMVPLAQVRAATRLEDRLAQAPDARAAARLLEEFAAAPAEGFRAEPAVERAVQLLGRTRAPQLPELADQLGWSQRQLRRLITDAVGYGPQSLHAVLRFQRAMAMARDRRIGLAQVAQRAGYADQAHLSREVRRLAGMTPTQMFGIEQLPP